VGTAGTVTCTIPGPLAPGGFGNFSITVNVNCGTTGTLTEGNYWISSTQEVPLLGPVVNTVVGCTQDSQCLVGNWCNETAKTCGPTLANGTTIPTDPPHAAPTLNGTCTVAAGTLVCTSAVCDTTDNKCGFLNGDGPCTVADGGVVCRSGVCDPNDLKCGYAVGDGPCTMANGGTVCRSGVCSANGLCEPPGGCNVDADCTGGKWCNESVHACTPKVGNGTPIPTDPPHMSPTLNGTCSLAAGTLTCVSAVCDVNDNKCGYANGDGPCTIATGGTVCRSSVCSVNNLCMPSGGCNVDGDCTGGNWCLETTHTCTPKVPNGSAVPNDPPHTSPTLSGTCTAPAAALTCISGVCDTDNLCGYANGDGPCTVGNGGLVCRSGVCSANGKCEPAGGCNVDADCTGGNWCLESTHSCTAKIANGGPVPNDPPHTSPTLNGACTGPAATLTCQSGVCDTSDNDCGYANGDGPCTMADAGTVCRSGACSVNGTCEPAGGCNVDGDCSGGNWCLESAHTCTPKVANGGAVPTDPPHTSPTLSGACTPAAGTLTCVSGVCDGGDNRCGYANGDGPCTPANGGTVCRSGACSANGTCEPAGGCNVDADCSAGNWCLESTHTCTPKLTNGTAIPTDPPHTPALNGTCTPASGAIVCISGVCDTNDNSCGFANGDGPCTLGNGATVCRSGACSVNGLCEPAGGCNADADCSAGDWCLESTHTCKGKLGNGVAMPNDPPHTGPTLSGACTPAAATLVCASGVCDSDDRCGYLNGDGPCSVATGGTVCRSGVCDLNDMLCGYRVSDGPCNMGNAGTVCRSTACSTNGTCEPLGGCDVDADCTGGNWCAEAAHVCEPKIPNGQLVPTDAPHTNPTLDGTCNGPAATLTCVSGVCDVNDNRCGYANGDGPCTTMNGGVVCRSGACSSNGVCEPAGGCNIDADCNGGSWCDERMHLCTLELVNGTPLPTDPPHQNPVLNGICTTAAGTLTCVSGVCDANDNRCGYANGDGPCTSGNGGLVCRSGVCSVNGLCEPVGGCNVDEDCTGGNWCNETAHACTPPLANGAPVPNDPPHKKPVLDGDCSVAAGALTCESGVCDLNDNECGYANGDGPCTQNNGSLVCRSGACSANGTCEPAGGCNVDADCMGGKWCDESLHSCAPQLANGQPVPTDGPHMNPTLTGMCTAAAGALTCVSGVCDLNDNKCGYANGDGPCTTGNGSVVCRSGMCSAGGTCQPAGGCNVDSDCTAGNWCNESGHMCTPQLANGQPVPTDGAHANPTLNGTCTAAAGTLTCTSAVCDTKDNECGFANGDGPCTMTNGGTVCRSGTCSTNGTCEPMGGCNVDADCTAGNWCNETMHMCAPTVANGMPVPTDGAHTSPTLNGTCTVAAGALTCTSAVCDVKDNGCGYALGDGPCTTTNGGTVCRSQKCGATGPATGTCVACTMNADCSGATPVCDLGTGACVQCTDSSACSGSTPICDTTMHTCVPCNGDNGTTSTEPCPTGEPFCFLSGPMMGSCGKCATNADCTGHMGNVCDTGTGLCVTGCFVDSDCASGNWCDANAPSLGMCVPKLPNGKPLPSTPAAVSMCSAEVGMRVCESGVCDPKDNTCGLANGDGPCTVGEQCRNLSCDTMTMTCQAPPCTSNADCPAGDYCKGDGTCAPKLPDGSACTTPAQCSSNACLDNQCGGPVVASGGAFCAARPQPGAGGDAVAAFGLMLAAAALSRRRRR
jgi:hypothetical protein